MQFLTTFALVIAGCAAGVADAQLQLVPDQEPQSVFAGDARKVTTVWQNTGDETAAAEIHIRLVQSSSATAIQLGETPWKQLQVLPRQTVLESAQPNFPAVRAGTKFLIQWLDDTNRVLGKTTVLVYPTNLLDELKSLVDGSANNLGVLDPHKMLTPTLNHSAIKFIDLTETGLDDFSGKLVIAGPCRPEDPEWNGLADRISRLAKKGTSVVWIQSPSKQKDKIWPSFYIVPENQSVVVVVQPELVADLAHNPQSQLNLIYFCKLALNPPSPSLPDLSAQR